MKKLGIFFLQLSVTETPNQIKGQGKLKFCNKMDKILTLKRVKWTKTLDIA